MKGNRIIKWMFALIVAAIIGFFGFVFKVNEGEYAVVTRFGAVRSEVTQADPGRQEAVSGLRLPGDSDP